MERKCTRGFETRREIIWENILGLCQDITRIQINV